MEDYCTQASTEAFRENGQEGYADSACDRAKALGQAGCVAREQTDLVPLGGDPAGDREDDCRGRGSTVAAAYVYIIGSENGPMKVGHTIDVSRRLRNHQRNSPQPLHVIATWNCGTAVDAQAAERYCHWLLREYRVQGEWFSVSPDVAVRVISNALGEKQTQAHPGTPKHLRNKAGRPSLGVKATTVRLSPEDLAEIEGIAGPRRVSEFIRDVVKAELNRRRGGDQ